jgi:hypothetical protein
LRITNDSALSAGRIYVFIRLASAFTIQETNALNDLDGVANAVGQLVVIIGKLAIRDQHAKHFHDLAVAIEAR